ncbi:phage holin family protein [Flavobacterium sp. C4GT6]|uniref:phage holin family protein n=1 Tax=Flavobacterium sp. C4GT6 TaxID=3103818 RepID=UPI002ED1272A
MEINLFNHYMYKLYYPFKFCFSNVTAFLFTLPAVTVVALSTSQKSGLFLGILFVIDFATGIGASWVEFKKAAPLVSASGKRYLIQSSKLRLSVVKFVFYGLWILVWWCVENIFVIKQIPSGHISTENLTLTTYAIAILCIIEIYSIFFENVKCMGFDIIQKIKIISRSGWGLYKTIKNSEDETN